MQIEPGPGAQPFAEELATQLREAVAGRKEFRTRHLRDDGSPRSTNRLALESSPYLLQHAHNPVDWYPWGDEAFAEARAADRPIFLSIGYSTCHWCHVMEQEWFEDADSREDPQRALRAGQGRPRGAAGRRRRSTWPAVQMHRPGTAAGR